VRDQTPKKKEVITCFVSIKLVFLRDDIEKFYYSHKHKCIVFEHTHYKKKFKQWKRNWWWNDL